MTKRRKPKEPTAEETFLEMASSIGIPIHDRIIDPDVLRLRWDGRENSDAVCKLVDRKLAGLGFVYISGFDPVPEDPIIESMVRNGTAQETHGAMERTEGGFRATVLIQHWSVEGRSTGGTIIFFLEEL